MKVTERFLKYISFETTSDEDSTSIPSTQKQKLLGEYLAKELKEIGLSDARMDDYGYVYGMLPANQDDLPAIGLIAHMDTSPAASGAQIKPRVISYQGGEIFLNDQVSIRPEDFECLRHYIGDDLIVTDGTTLLGADDKAGIAEIVTALEYLLQHPEIPHGKIFVGFTPDEEIGRGADHFDLHYFDAAYAYTVDGGALGELEYECFNAASAKLTVHGLSTHTGSAKNKMKNAIRIAAEFVSRLPENEIPERTEGYEGFYHVDSMSGDVTTAQVNLLVRDHDRNNFHHRKEFLIFLLEEFNYIYGKGTLELQMEDTYYNMREKIEPVMEIVDKAKKAMQNCGVEPKVMAIRGGTDGARLSYEGLPCPNLSTGGENFHGIHEFVSIPSMEKMVEVLVEIAGTV